jgi:hypothetical protein
MSTQVIVVLVNLDLTARKGTWAFLLGVYDAAAQRVNAAVTRALGRADDPTNVADAEG